MQIVDKYINYLLINASKLGRKESSTVTQGRIKHIEEKILDSRKAVGNVSAIKLSPIKGNFETLIKKGNYHAKL